MGELSKIEWTDHTFNPWRGCDKVSAGCDNCYAETMSHRNPAVLGEWGPEGRRAIAAESYWNLPLKWNRQAKEAGVRSRVFCLSLGDVWEDRPELIDPRGRLLTTIAATPYLDWLLLTKRPEGIDDRLHEVVRHTHDGGDELASYWLDGDAPRNVWLGISAENQETLDLRWPSLARIPAVVRFLSLEPLLGPIDASHALCDFELGRGKRGNLHWVICGGESGPHARPMHPQWARSLRDQCQQAGVAFHFKQWGEWAPGGSRPGTTMNWLHTNGLTYGTGERPRHTADRDVPVFTSKVGKHAAGRLLDGRTWDEFPKGA